MIKKLLVALAFCGVLAAQDGRPAFMPGQIVVQARSGADPNAVALAMSRVGGRVSHHISQTRHNVLSVREDQTDRVMAALRATGLFTVVERDGIAYPVGTTPNDPYFSSQWYLSAVQAPTAWGTTVGSSTPIAMVDSGVDLTHPDLAPRVTAGWNFLVGSTNTQDTMGHGTATAGIVGAVTNNGTGISGMTWSNPIMPLVVVDSTGYASYSNMASAIEYAADHGARIVNISLGGTTSSSILQSAVNYAWNKGTVVFAAAGNSSSSAPLYPAGCQYVVAVSATEPNNQLASFSEYGTWIDLAAPGDSILTTTDGGGYGYWYGTSFSAPIAASVGALVLAVRPTLSASGLVSLLEQNADNIGSSEYFGYGLVDAAKAVAAASATTAPAVATPPTVTITSPATNSSVTGTVTVAGSASDSAGINNVSLYCDGSAVTSTTNANFSIPWNTASATTGAHTLTATAIDMNGNAGSASVTVNVTQPPPPADTTPPTVHITAPPNGSHINSGPAGPAKPGPGGAPPPGSTVTVSVSATDNVGVTHVSIYIDGVQVYTGTAAPYNYQWNTQKVAAGSHTISATAWDAAGNHATATITVTK